MLRFEVSEDGQQVLPGVDIGDATVVIGSDAAARIRLPVHAAREAHVRIVGRRWTALADVRVIAGDATQVGVVCATATKLVVAGADAATAPAVVAGADAATAPAVVAGADAATAPAVVAGADAATKLVVAGADAATAPAVVAGADAATAPAVVAGADAATAPAVVGIGAAAQVGVVRAAEAAQIGAVVGAGDATQVGAVRVADAAQVGAVRAAEAAQVGAVRAAEAAQVGAVVGAGDATQVGAVRAAEAAQVGAVVGAGAATQVGVVRAAEAAQVGAVRAGDATPFVTRSSGGPSELQRSGDRGGDGPGVLHRAGESGEIGGGVTFQLGEYRVRVAASPAGARAAPLQRTESLARELVRGLLGADAAPILEVERGPVPGVKRVLPPPEATLVIGRGEESTWIVIDEDLSRAHAEVHRGWDGVAIRDLGSKNGTKIDGARITARTQLHDGALIELGNVALRFRDPAERHLRGEATAAATPRAVGRVLPAVPVAISSWPFVIATVICALALAGLVWILAA